MSTTLYKALGTPYLKNIIRDALLASKELGIDFFCVGALARNVWYTNNNQSARGTKDVEFGVYIPNEETYLSLKTKLIEDYDYTASGGNAFCLISPNGIPVDFLPFGEIEENGEVSIEGKGLSSIRLDGFKEVYQNGLQKIDIEGDIVNICTISSVILLKLIAFDDRPEHRAKDPLDISSIIEMYPDFETDLIWDEYSFLYEGELSHDEIGIMVIGYEMKKVVKNNNKLVEKVVKILDKGISLKNKLASHMILDSNKDTVESNIEKLKLLKEGFNGSD